MWFRAQAASWQDIAALTRRMAGNEQELRRDFWRKLKGAVADLPFAEDLLAAYYCAFDRQTPLHVKAVLLGAVAYFTLPTDLIPDYIPVIGFIDDAAVLAGAIKIVNAHIKPEHREAARRTLARLRGEA
ncbi:MAG: YkvA family protein [Xanthobacteraceae bacterium]